MKELDALFPDLANMPRIGWAPRHQTALAEVLALYERLPKELLAVLSTDDETLLDRAIRAVRGLVDLWKGMDFRTLKMIGGPGLEQEAKFGNRNALQVIRDIVSKCPDEAPAQIAPVAGLTAFVSYSHEDRKYGGQAKRVLDEVGIDAFLAHEDLNVSDEWRHRILEELRRCDIFVPILSKAFLASKWAPQEVGYVISRSPDVAIAPISIDDTVACGFISHLQSRRIPEGGITRELLVVPLASRFPRTILPGLIRIAGKAGDFRSAESKMEPLVPLFPLFTRDEAQALAEAAVKNGQIWLAALCRQKYLPEFIRHHGKSVRPDTLRALTYQLDKGEWFRG